MAVALTKQSPNPPPQPRRLSLKDVCARYDLSRGAIYNGLERGSFPKPLKVGGVLRWREEDLNAFEAKQLEEEV